MEKNILDIFIKENINIITLLLDKDVENLSLFKTELINSKNKSKKLYEISKDFSKIIDLYDESHKIKFNRNLFIKDYITDLIKLTATKEKENDYFEIISIIIGETVQYDKSNWNKIYDKLKEIVETEDINKNNLYSLDYEDLKPKKLINILKRNINDEMIDGGTFSFETYTQEMLGIINEFILIKGTEETKKYLDQGIKSNVPIEELLKEVNAASLVEPFTFSGSTPQFKRASSGQFDGFILHENQAKVILATKSENTNIENDSMFRHYLTALLIKKKIDETAVSEQLIKNKTKEWFDYYNNNNKKEKAIFNIKRKRRLIKKKNQTKITECDLYIKCSFADKVEKQIEDALKKGNKTINLKINNIENKVPEIEDAAIRYCFGNEKNQKSKIIKIDIEKAKEALIKIKKIINDQNIIEESYIKNVENKIGSKKFKEQILLDVKKVTMVMNNKYLSIKDMISFYNRNTNKALEDLGVLNSNNNCVNEFGIVEMENIKKLKTKHNVKLIYFGSVSAKKNSSEYEYDRIENKKIALRNKEYRYGLNLLAYANELSASKKGTFKIAPDAAIEFIELIELRAKTKERNDQIDIDLKKINNNNFISKIIDTTYETFYNNRFIENDSINFWENMMNASNVILADVLLGYEIDKEENINIKIEESFINTMKYRTKKNKEFDLIKTIDSLKYYTTINSKKLNKSVGIIDSLNLRLDKIIEMSDEIEMKKIKEKYNINVTEENKNKRKSRRNMF